MATAVVEFGGKSFHLNGEPLLSGGTEASLLYKLHDECSAVGRASMPRITRYPLTSGGEHIEEIEAKDEIFVGQTYHVGLVETNEHTVCAGEERARVVLVKTEQVLYLQHFGGIYGL